MSKLDRFKRRRTLSKRTETDAEQTLWDNLYRIPVEGTHFRRQVMIGPYRADFGSLRFKLLIEVDGAIHHDDARQERDALRDRWLENVGYCVIRFSNRQVTTDMNSVLEEIGRALQARKDMLRL